MKTDLPLKRLTRLRPTDLLPLLGETDAEVLAVETLELPASKTSLDCVLRLQREGSEPYLHLIEWQGWNDPVFLWRTLTYLGWLGQNQKERPILVTLIYLKPEDDVGASLTQGIADSEWFVRLPCVRLWEYDATMALASGRPGLVTLAPLMRGATSELVAEAAQTLLRETEQPVQGELLTALGVFAEPLFSAERFTQLVTKERLMATDLISYLLKDTVEEYEQKHEVLVQEFEQKQVALTIALEQEKLAREQEKLAREQERLARVRELAKLLQSLHQIVEDAIITHFPDASALLTRTMRQITDPLKLTMLHSAVLRANELAEVERLVQAYAEDKPATQ
jgi:hypothetical protein